MKRNLDKRSQIGLSLGILAITLVVMVALYIPAGPGRSARTSKTEYANACDDWQKRSLDKLDQAERLAKQKQLMEKLAQRKADFNLFAFVDGLLNSQGLRNRAQLDQFKLHNGSPKEPMVQLKLEGVAFDELASLLHEAYGGSNLVSVYKVDAMRPATSGKGLDCDITLVTLTQ